MIFIQTSRHGEKKCQVQIKACDDNGKKIVATLQKVLLPPDYATGYFRILR